MENKIENIEKRLNKIITTNFNEDYSIDSEDKDAIENALDIIEKYKNSDYETISLENNHLKEELEKLQDENKELKKSKYVYGIDMDFDYIPKQKIRDKIKDIKEDKEDKYYYKFLEYRDIEITIQILEELLENEKKMNKNIKIIDFSSVALSSTNGEEIRNEIEKYINDFEKIILDFDGITLFATSFFNLTIGYFVIKLSPEKFLEKIECINLTNLGKETYEYSYNNACLIYKKSIQEKI